MKRVTVSLIGLLMAAPLLAQEPVQEREHVVRTGDTLWDLASFYFSDPWLWPTIYEANTTVVDDPHWIYPEEVLVIPGISGDTEPAPRVAPRVAVRPADRPVRTVFYTAPPVRPASQSSQATVLSEPTLERVPVRPGEFNSAPYVDHAGNLDVVGVFIRALRENRDVGGLPSAHPQDDVFLAYAGDRRPEPESLLLMVEVGPYVDGTRGQRLIMPTGIVRVTDLQSDVIRGQIHAMYAPIHRGQQAIPLPMFPDFMVEQARPIEAGDGFDLEGRVIEFLQDPPMPSRTDLGLVNLGTADGVAVGDLFTAFLPERASRQRGASDILRRIERLPPENVAELRVVRVTENVATVRVDRLFLPRLAAGIGVRRTHRVQ